MKGNREQVIAVEMNDHIAKPLDPDLMLKIMANGSNREHTAQDWLPEFRQPIRVTDHDQTLFQILLAVRYDMPGRILSQRAAAQCAPRHQPPL